MRVKYFWYHMRLLRDTYKRQINPLRKAAHELQSLLGDEHDFAVMRRIIVRDFGKAADAERLEVLTGLIISKRKSLIDQACPRAHLVFAEKPKVFVSRIGAYWEAWKSGQD